MIIEGARQVGKTWLMKEFGRQAYADTVYINFDSNSRMVELFASDLDTERLIMGFELYVGHKIAPHMRRSITLYAPVRCSASLCIKGHLSL